MLILPEIDTKIADYIAKAQSLDKKQVVPDIFADYTKFCSDIEVKLKEGI